VSSSARWEASADLVVVGSGVAGLTAALDAAELGLRVVVITKDAPGAGCTALAQGGVAVVMGDVPGDSVDAHIGDTLTAGGGVNDQAAVASIIAAGPAAVARLRARGAVFDLAPGLGGSLARTREGGHRALRVIHAGCDGTGAELERALLAATADRGLALLTGHVAVDALRDATGAVVGLAVLDDEVPPDCAARAGCGGTASARHRGRPRRGGRAARRHRQALPDRRAPARRPRAARRRGRRDHPAARRDRC